MKYVALLRGVNVGGRVIKSAELKNCFEDAGYKYVQTVLATGNVIFTSGKDASVLAPMIEKMLEATFKFSIKALVISAQELAEIVRDFPFNDASTDFHRYVIFLPDQPDSQMLARLILDYKLEAIQPGDKVIYWRVLKGHTLDSDFAKQSVKSVQNSFSTTRNLNTLEKILAKI